MDRALSVCLLVIAACGRPAPAPRTVAAPPPVPVYEMHVQAPLTPPVGAVAIPGTYPGPEYSIRQRDMSVTIAELPRPDATWRDHATLAYKGRVAIALSIAGHERLDLTVVDTVTETESGYPGGLEDFSIGSADTNEQPESGNAMPPRDSNSETGEFVGPMMFAVRLLPRTGAPESERRQFAVYTRDRAIFVASKLVTDARWLPQLRIDAPKSTEIIAIDPGWH